MRARAEGYAPSYLLAIRTRPPPLVIRTADATSSRAQAIARRACMTGTFAPDIRAHPQRAGGSKRGIESRASRIRIRRVGKSVQKFPLEQAGQYGYVSGEGIRRDMTLRDRARPEMFKLFMAGVDMRGWCKRGWMKARGAHARRRVQKSEFGSAISCRDPCTETTHAATAPRDRTGSAGEARGGGSEHG